MPSENERARISRIRGVLASTITDPAARRAFIARQGEQETLERKERRGPARFYQIKRETKAKVRSFRKRTRER